MRFLIALLAVLAIVGAAAGLIGSWIAYDLGFRNYESIYLHLSLSAFCALVGAGALVRLTKVK